MYSFINVYILKIIDNVIIKRDKESSSSSDLKVVLTIDGFYL